MGGKKKIDRKDWRTLQDSEWRTPTVHAMVIDLNAEMFGVTQYIPLRTWAFEQGVIKRALAQYGPSALRETITRAFREHRVTPQYPQLTAGFLIAYLLPRIMPQVLAEQARASKQAEYCGNNADNNVLTDDEIIDLM